jgi:hypothetical protein
MSNGQQQQAAAMNPIKTAALKALLGDDFAKIETVLGGAEQIQMKADASGATFKSQDVTETPVAEAPAAPETEKKDDKPADVVTEQDYVGDLTVAEFGGLFNQLLAQAMATTPIAAKVDFGEQVPVTAKSLEPMFVTMKAIADIVDKMEQRINVLEGGAPTGSGKSVTNKSADNNGEGTQLPPAPPQVVPAVNPLVNFWVQGKVGAEQ